MQAIDVTDARLKTAFNRDVMTFVRRASPHAHTDVGSLLVSLAGRVAGTHAYSPAFRQCLYVVLHDDADRIVAIAYGQRGLAIRVRPARQREASAEGAVPEPEIGGDWMRFPADARGGYDALLFRLAPWCAWALADASGDEWPPEDAPSAES